MDQTILSCSFCLNIGTRGIWTMLILIPTLVFWIFNPKFIFGHFWAKKVSYPIYMKISTYVILRMPIFIRTLVFSISKPKSIFGQTFLIRKILIPTIIPFIINNSHIILLIAYVFTFSCDEKYKNNKHLIQLFIFISASKPSSESLQSHLQDTLCTSFQAK